MQYEENNDCYHDISTAKIKVVNDFTPFFVFTKILPWRDLIT